MSTRSLTPQSYLLSSRQRHLLPILAMGLLLTSVMLAALVPQSAWASNAASGMKPAGALSSVLPAPAQVPSLRPLYGPGFVLSESFDGTTFPPTGWGTTIVTGTTQGWSRVTSALCPTASPHSGPGVAQFKSCLMTSGDSTRLYTPILDLTGQTTPTLKLWMYHDTGFSSANDRIQVQISTDGGTNYTTVLTTVLRYDGSTGWKWHTVDLSAYIGQSNVRLGFLAISAYGSSMLIDDVTVGPPAPGYDGSSKSVAPGIVRFAGQILTYTIVLSNGGNVPGMAAALNDPIPTGTAYVLGSAAVQGGGALTATASSIDWSGTVTNGQSIIVTFQVSVTILSAIVNTVTISDPLTPGPVVRTASAYVPYTQLSESFDGATFPPENWGTTIVTGTIQGWSRVTSGYFPNASPHSGAAMARFNAFSMLTNCPYSEHRGHSGFNFRPLDVFRTSWTRQLDTHQVCRRANFLGTGNTVSSNG